MVLRSRLYIKTYDDDAKNTTVISFWFVTPYKKNLCLQALVLRVK